MEPLYEAEYDAGSIKVFIHDKAPKEAGDKADVIELRIVSDGVQTSRFYTPDEALNAGTGLIYAANHLYEKYVPRSFIREQIRHE